MSGRLARTLLALALVSCVSPRLASPGRSDWRTVPDFGLTNWDGRHISLADLRGRTVLMTFTFARCDFGCPMVTHQFQVLDEELGSLADLVFLHLSVNPERDTPEEIRAHWDKHGIEPGADPRWLFLRGEAPEVDRVLEDYGIAVQRTPMENDILTELTTRVLVIDPRGRLMASFDTYQWSTEEMHRAIEIARRHR